MPKSFLHVNFAKGFRGGERQTLLLIQELSKKGYVQTLLTRNQAELAKRVAALKLPHVMIIEVKKPYLLSLSLLKKADVVHAHETKGAQFAFLGYLFFKTPYLITRWVDSAIKKSSFTILIKICERDLPSVPFMTRIRFHLSEWLSATRHCMLRY